MFQFSHVADVAALSTYYYSFVAPTEKEIMLFDRTLLLTSGDGLVQTITNPTSITHGAPIFVLNCWLDKPFPETAFYDGSTDVVGGYAALPELLSSSAHKGSSVAERGGVVIIPRGTVGAVQVDNKANQDFAEVDLSLFNDITP
jgi:hypothetical protein